MIFIDRQKTLQVLRLLRSPLHRKKIDDLNKQKRLAFAGVTHRINELAQSGNKPIIANPQQWTTRNITHACRFHDENTRTPFSKTTIPVEVLLSHKAILSRTPGDHGRNPRSATSLKAA